MAAVLTDSRTADARTLDDRIERLSSVSVKRVIEPDDAVPGHVGDGAVLPPELLTVAGLDLDLTPEQLVTLSREEVASITDAGVRIPRPRPRNRARSVSHSRSPTISPSTTATWASQISDSVRDRGRRVASSVSSSEPTPW